MGALVRSSEAGAGVGVPKKYPLRKRIKEQMPVVQRP